MSGAGPHATGVHHPLHLQYPHTETVKADGPSVMGIAVHHQGPFRGVDAEGHSKPLP
jgi:hypothetical protein